MTTQTSGIDLHIHTTVSDGTDRPEELLPKIREKGLKLFSVTDHDDIKAC
ncbi:MAG: PHP domain-containing protein, partial [Candidatus Limivicinus sp.]